jgi:hypothetical protein
VATLHPLQGQPGDLGRVPASRWGTHRLYLHRGTGQEPGRCDLAPRGHERVLLRFAQHPDAGGRDGGARGPAREDARATRDHRGPRQPRARGQRPLRPRSAEPAAARRAGRACPRRRVGRRGQGARRCARGDPGRALRADQGYARDQLPGMSQTRRGRHGQRQRAPELLPGRGRRRARSQPGKALRRAAWPVRDRRLRAIDLDAAAGAGAGWAGPGLCRCRGRWRPGSADRVTQRGRTRPVDPCPRDHAGQPARVYRT